MRSPAKAGLNQLPASSSFSSARVRSRTMPCPSVVPSREKSWMTTGGRHGRGARPARCRRRPALLRAQGCKGIGRRLAAGSPMAQVQGASTVKCFHPLPFSRRRSRNRREIRRGNTRPGRETGASYSAKRPEGRAPRPGWSAAWACAPCLLFLPVSHTTTSGTALKDR